MFQCPMNHTRDSTSQADDAHVKTSPLDARNAPKNACHQSHDGRHESALAEGAHLASRSLRLRHCPINESNSGRCLGPVLHVPLRNVSSARPRARALRCGACRRHERARGHGPSIEKSDAASPRGTPRARMRKGRSGGALHSEWPSRSTASSSASPGRVEEFRIHACEEDTVVAGRPRGVECSWDVRSGQPSTLDDSSMSTRLRSATIVRPTRDAAPRFKLSVSFTRRYPHRPRLWAKIYDG